MASEAESSVLHGAGCRDSRGRWIAVVSPLVLLAVEAVLLTPRVEFNGGVMRTLASPQMFTAVFFASVLFVMLEGRQLMRSIHPGHVRGRVGWLAIHLLLFVGFYELTLYLQGSGRSQGGPLLAAAWTLGMASVGATAFPVFLPLRTLTSWVKERWHKAAGCLLLGATLALLTSSIQRMWRIAGEPTTAVAAAWLRVVGHDGVVHRISSGDSPVIGLRGGPLIRVTPSCGEMESLAAFLVLGAALLVTRWRAIDPLRLLSVIVVGMLGLSILNGVRLGLLVEAGVLTNSVDVCVRLAHSRLSGIGFLALSAFVYLATARWWNRNISQ